MLVNLNVKIKAGPRTKTEVIVRGPAVNEKTIKFANGKEITETQIAEWISLELAKVLLRIECGYTTGPCSGFATLTTDFNRWATNP